MTENDVLTTVSEISSGTTMFFDRLFRESDTKWALAAVKLFNARCQSQSLATITLLEEECRQSEQRVRDASHLIRRSAAITTHFRSMIGHRQLKLCL